MKFIIKPAAGEFYFNIKARNGQIIATSEMYARKESVKKAIKLIAGSAAKAAIIDEAA